MKKTNILIFPRLNMPMVDLIRFWHMYGFVIQNTKRNNLCLVDTDDLEQQNEEAK